ncbi:glycosyltransferase family 1 protein [Rhizophagus clarus]|uniref:Glycosyltransferase family 1 protein n=1 Tax=Rhizophagus clarus TaxID=94130 RepID=A0A8H3LGD5_9GLOM|nr:glycosyltransferase family 1 protein [Rhizophagus clarus]
MNKKNFIFLLSLFLLNLIFRANVITAVQDYVPTNFDINHSPKNILVSSYTGGRSHLKPMLDIAAILVERGHNVILLTSGNYTPASEYPTIKQISMGPPLSIKGLKFAANLIEKDVEFTMFTTIFERNLESYKRAFEKYKETAIDNNIDLFICYAIMNDACLDVAHALKKPVVGFMSFLNVLETTTYKSDPVFRCKNSLENESLLERLKCTVIQPLRLYSSLYPVLNKLNDIRLQMGVEPVDMSLKRLIKTSLIFVDAFFGFELPQTLPPNILEIGPIMSKEYPPLTPELSDFINGHKRDMVDGVIWALSQTSKEDFSLTLNLTDGSQIQTASILNNEHPHVLITEFAPQFAVLNHTNTKLFFSHGGVASVHESLFTGTPLLILPIGGDQMGNAEKLKIAGVALSLNKFDLEVDDIINKINILLKDEDIKKNIERMKGLAKVNSRRKYRAADLIEYMLYRNDLNIDSNQELKEFVPADKRMGFIRGNNYDVYGIILGFVGGTLWIIFKLIRFIVRKISPSSKQKPKRE